MKSLEWECRGEHLVLLPQKAIFWREQKALIVADLHIGKVGHFRKAGIAIPKLMEQEELAVLSDLVHEFGPERILFLGDLFHSEMNNDWNWLELWRPLFPKVEMILVKGNHDILHPEYYLNAGFSIVDELEIGPFMFVHEPLTLEQLRHREQYIISGHIHPGVKLRGGGRQSLSIACFYFGEAQAILPAFGKFTGKYCMQVSNSSNVFGIIDRKVIPL